MHSIRNFVDRLSKSLKPPWSKRPNKRSTKEVRASDESDTKSPWSRRRRVNTRSTEEVKTSYESAQEKFGQLQAYVDASHENHLPYAHNINLFMQTFLSFRERAKNEIAKGKNEFKYRSNPERIFKEFLKVTKEDFEELKDRAPNIEFTDNEMRVLFFRGPKRE